MLTSVGSLSPVFALPAAMILLASFVLLPPESAYAGEPEPFTHNGESFFPIGVYDHNWVDGEPLTTDTTLKAAADTGFNMVQIYVSPTYSSADKAGKVQILNSAMKHGLVVKFRLHTFQGKVVSAGTTDQLENAWNHYENNLGAFIGDIKDHEALFAYSTIDEPEHHKHSAPLANLEKMKDFVLHPTRDPDHPIFLNFADILQKFDQAESCHDPADSIYPMAKIKCTTDLYQKWAQKGGTAYTQDIYPVGLPYYSSEPQGAPRRLRGPSDGFNKLNQVLNNDQASQGFILQSVPWRLMNYNLCCNVGYSDYDPNDDSCGYVESPTERQTRFMAFDLITQGAKSLEWFNVSKLKVTCTTADGNELYPPIGQTALNDTWAGIQKVVGQLSDLQHILAADSCDASAYTVPFHVRAVCKEYPGRGVAGSTKVLIVTHAADSSAGKVIFRVEGWENTQVKVLFEDRVLSPQSGEFHDDGFGESAGWEVHVYAPRKGPFGHFGTPPDGAGVSGSIPVTGWALDNLGVKSVKIYRKNGNNLVYIGDANFVEGARPDVAATYPSYPNNTKAGWGYMLLTNFLPSGNGTFGNGTFELHAIVTDVEGNTVDLGARTIYVDNANRTKPFGAIDTPVPGGVASGTSYRVNGWVLSPQADRTIPTDGSTIKVVVDRVVVGQPAYNIYREDIAELFPGLTNSNGAGGSFNLDTTTLANGIHTIQWTVADDTGNSDGIDGIGSRYFTVYNKSVNSGSQTGTITTQQAGTTSTDLGSGTTFGWSAGTNVTQYRLLVGTQQGAGDIHLGSPTTAHSQEVTNLPNDGEEVWAQLTSTIDGQDYSVDYLYPADCDANGIRDDVETDTDGDGVIDACDGCPNDPYKTHPGPCGCGEPDTDSDDDGVLDCVDLCPGTPQCALVDPQGCPSDSDGDGSYDGCDGCPSDPDKTAPGICGCGNPDAGDSDGDGVLDCVDNCPELYNPGQGDLDGDGIGDACEWCGTTELVEIVETGLGVNDHFGLQVDMSGEYAIFGAFTDDAQGVDAGAAYIYRITGSSWSREMKLVPPDADATDDRFGNSVAIDGSTAVVGAPRDDEQDSNAGAVYVFEKQGSAWIPAAKLLASDEDGNPAGDWFGHAVALDGDLLAIGAPYDDQSASDAGAVYAFVRNGSTWSQEAKVLAPDGGTDDRLGLRNRLALDGDTVLIGADRHDSGGVDAGVAYVFVRDPGPPASWSEQDRLTASDIAAGDHFGNSVRIEGSTAVIGTHMKDEDLDGDQVDEVDVGAVYVFRRSGSVWSEEVMLQPPDLAAGDMFGFGVFLAGDILVIGAHGKDEDLDGDQSAEVDGGAAYVYRDNGTAWVERAKLLPSAGAGAAYDQFGIAVALAGDALVVGANMGNSTTAGGTAYLFRGIADCDANGLLDTCEILDTPSLDSDGDGVMDGCESCPGDSGKTEPGVCGCGTPDTDTDLDGVPDCTDLCPGTPACAQPIDAVGCPQDGDGDGAVDGCDNCPQDPNDDQADLDGDGVGDVCDEDVDGDTVPDVDDNCPHTANPDQDDQDSDGIGDACDCAPTEDGDQDNVCDGTDLCPGSAPGAAVDPNGCADPQVDEDADGICDLGAASTGPGECELADGDLCPGTAAGAPVATCGCSDLQVDADGDGICDDGAPCAGPGACTGIDYCPDDPDKTDPGQCGCGIPEAGDADGDGALDCVELCPGTASGEAVDVHGCSDSQVDADGDGVCDESAPSEGPGECQLGDGDRCPDTAPGDAVGSCGCSLVQVDLDGDGLCDPGAPCGGPVGCTGSDNCPAQPNPGQADSDGDGTGDACDNCPADPGKIDPGVCGCNYRETPGCLPETPSFTRLGEMAGGDPRTRIWGRRGITDSTLVGGPVAVGRGSDGGEGSGFTAFRWQDGAFTGLPRAGSGPYSSLSWAYGVSADGSVVYGHDSDTGQSVVWTAGGGGWADAHHVTLANGSGWGALCAGGGAIVDFAGNVAWRYTTNDGWATAGGVDETELPGMTAAYGCSKDGTVVVGTDTGGPAIYGGPSGAGKVRLPGSGRALAVSDDGKLVAGVSLGNPYGKDQPCKWEYADGVWTQTILPLLPGMVPELNQKTGQALAVSADGGRIAGHFREDGDYYIPLVWDSWGVRRLEDVLNDAGVFLEPGWYLADLGAMSPDGHTFGGSMSDQPIRSADDNRHAWIATVGQDPAECGSFEHGFETAADWDFAFKATWPASSTYRSTWGIAKEHSGSYGLALSNQAYAHPSTTYIAAGPGSHTLAAWVRGEMDDSSEKGWILRAYFYDSNFQPLSPSWQNAASCSGSSGCLSTTWTEKSGTVEAPDGTAYLTIKLYFYMAGGWMVYDDVSLDQTVLSVATHGVDGGFETATGWTFSKSSSFPGTSVYRATSGTAAPHSGSYALALSNQAYAYPITTYIAAGPGSHTLAAWVRGEMDDSSKGGWILRAYLYDSNYQELFWQNAAKCKGSSGCLSTTWSEESGTVEAPAGTAYLRIRLYFHLAGGWVAYDGVALDGAVLSVAGHGVDGGFETATGWSFDKLGDFPGTSVKRGTSGPFAPHSGSYALALSNQAYAYPVTDSICAYPGTHQVSTWVRGEMNESSFGGWILRARFYDSDGQDLGYQNAASCYGSASCLSATWSQESGQVEAPAGTAFMTVRLFFYQAGGWAAYDDVEVVKVE